MVITGYQGAITKSVDADLQRLEKSALKFLAISNIVNQSGDVFSWLNSARSGYVYPEIMGYYLTFCCQYLVTYPNNSQLNHCLYQRVHKVAQRLQQLVTLKGGIGRGNSLYLFDTSIAVSGLLAYHTYLNGSIDQACLDRMASFIVYAIKHQQPITAICGEHRSVANRWSTVFGSSMVKVVLSLHRLADWTGNGHYRKWGQQLVEHVLERYVHQGAFTVLSKPSMVYTHAHCYALEGLLDIHCQGYGNMMSHLIAGADCLQQWQNQDGSLFNWNNPPHPLPMKIGDATAQAIRIWLAVDRDRYRLSIQRGFNFLQQLSAPQGGLYYGAGSNDINPWVTMFTAQALDWYLRGCKPHYIV